jgi:hypothetical protein
MEAVRRHTSLPWETVEADTAARFWSARARAMDRHPTTLRIGCVPTGLAGCCDILARLATDTAISISAPAGMIRVTADCTADALHRMRHALTVLEAPVTLERAPWSLLSRTGHFGAYREGVGPLVSRLRETFDPARVLAVPLEAAS